MDKYDETKTVCEYKNCECDCDLQHRECRMMSFHTVKELELLKTSNYSESTSDIHVIKESEDE